MNPSASDDRNPLRLMRLAMALTGLLVLMPLFAAAEAAPAPEPFEARYEITGAGIPLGAGRVSLKYTLEGYRYERHTEPRGVVSWFRDDEVSEFSEGAFDDGYPVPRHYEYRLDADGKARHEIVEFDRQQDRVVDAYKGKTRQFPLETGMLDRASLELALFADLRAGHRSDLNYVVIERRKRKDYVFEIVGEEEIEVPYGRFHTLKLRVIRDTDKRSTELWVAPDLDFLPIRTDHIEKGYRASMRLTTLEGISTP